VIIDHDQSRVYPARYAQTRGGCNGNVPSATARRARGPHA
jgi:hypothetical protein